MMVSSPPQARFLSAFNRVRMPHSFEVIHTSASVSPSPVWSSPADVPDSKSAPLPLSPRGEVMTSRAWTERTTKYVLLKYFYWKYSVPNVMSLHEMYKTISASVGLDLGVSKTSTQIRDKINNVKSSYKKDLLAKRNGSEFFLKNISAGLWTLMDKYFDEEKARSFDVIDEINADIRLLLQ